MQVLSMCDTAHFISFEIIFCMGALFEAIALCHVLNRFVTVSFILPNQSMN